jgi:hypothetical protein
MEEPLIVHEKNGSTVLPLEKITNSKSLRAGVRDADGLPVDASLLFRNRRGIEKQVIFPGGVGADQERVAGSALYMGPLFSHFGHFLLESLARIWLVRELPDIPLAWSIDAAVQKPAYHAWQADILDLLGVQNRPLFISRATTFEKVYVPEPGYRIQNFFHPQHRDFLAVVPHRPEPGRFTWLSRAKLSGRGNRLASLLDERFAAAGWQVIHPETIPISEQLVHLAASERIAGEQGSAFHLLMFLKDIEHLKIDIVDRDQDLPPKSQNKNYRTIAVAKHLDQTVHRCAFERFISRRGAAVDKIGENSFKYLDVLGVPRPSPAKPSTTDSVPEAGTCPTSATAARLAALAQSNAATNYLEIGVARGTTFLQADFGLKHAVGPRFDFDTRSYESDTCRFFEMSPEDFFQHFAESGLNYDVIRLHGLLGFERVFRAFCSSQAHAHDRTIWLIDDICPGEVFVPAAVKAPRAAPDSGGALWRGDVYKTIPAIHDFFPNISYRTVVGGGSPQSVLIRRRSTDFRHQFENIGAISRMSYTEFLEKKGLLNVASDEEMLAWLKG